MSAYQGKNVLVAGGAGLMGQSLIPKLLAQGAHVRATQYKTRKIAIMHRNLEIVSCDFWDDDQARAAFRDIDIAFLAAAKVRGAKAMRDDPSGLILYNLNLHAKLLHLVALAKVEKCSLVSSSYVYPHTGKPNVEAEGFQGDPPAVGFGLGWVCRYLEKLCMHLQMTSQTKFAIIRPTAYYGPHDLFDAEQSHVIPALIAKAVRRMDPFEVWGNGEDVRCFTYVEDLTDGLMLTLEKYAVAEALNICTAQSHTVREVLPILFEHLGFQPRVVFDPSKPSMMPYKVSNPAKAKAVLGWEAKVSFAEGLKKTIDWHQAQSRVSTPLA